jgi:hypothetical protein
MESYDGREKQSTFLRCFQTIPQQNQEEKKETVRPFPASFIPCVMILRLAIQCRPCPLDKQVFLNACWHHLSHTVVRHFSYAYR